MTWHVTSRMFGDFGELAVECELLSDVVADDHCFAFNRYGPAHYFLNGLEITEQEARQLTGDIADQAAATAS